ncbi:GTP-binding protein [Glutamicibacter sp. PS]|uniref:GTPase family protein n=1 Tax=Glutamicibacter sp. PS TaxID=3075634 RepID=UPI002842E52F|nr:GTP-binding protein [Glutamicibacter sp. PS]MDR4533004.1 50S ribosome-binding GTPase [Glutamicibacter sp. PS]
MKTQKRRQAFHDQVSRLSAALELGYDYLPSEVQQRTGEVLERVQQRRQLSAEHTVIGLFGATGSGKSSLFNALTGTDLARPGARRPTTTRTLAAVYKAEGTQELLDWLQVNERQELTKVKGPLAKTKARQDAGLILLDLPDMDSIEESHHEMVRRLSGQADFMIWVLDPQKYADASIHEHFLHSLMPQRDNVIVVLNQIDRVASSDRAAVLDSLRKTLEATGFSGVEVLAVSAMTGEGLEELSTRINSVVSQHDQAIRRLRVDVDQLVHELDEQLTVSHQAPVPAAEQHVLERTVAQAHGTEKIADALAASYRLDAARNTGWPLLSWVVKFKRNPLKSLQVQKSGPESELRLSSRPELSPVEQATVDNALDAYTASSVGQLPPQWQHAAQTTLREPRERLNDEIDRSIVGTPLGADKGSWWWPIFKVIQWLSLVVALGGALWLGAVALAGYFQFELPPTPRVEGIAIPTLMVLIGVLLGIVLGVLTGLLHRLVAKLKKRTALNRLNKAVALVLQRVVIAPITAHLTTYNEYAALVREAARKVE